VPHTVVQKLTSPSAAKTAVSCRCILSSTLLGTERLPAPATVLEGLMEASKPCHINQTVQYIY